MLWRGIIERYREHLCATENTPVITLNEGNTPLIPAPRVAAMLGENIELFLKFEGLNPTGSFKDRGMTLAVSKAVEFGSRAVMCASTGNTSAAAAAYAARAGIDCAVIIPDGNIALGKLAQALMHGAKVFAIEGNFDDALNIVKHITSHYPITLVNSVNPCRLEGQKTGSFEVIDALGDAPHIHALPVGNAGNISAYWRGYRQYHTLGRTTRLPKMIGFQAEGAAPIVRGHRVEQPDTIATAIRIGNPESWKLAEAARDDSGGLIDMVSDAEILEAYRILSRKEGVLCEPSSATGVAGLLKLASQGYFKDTNRIVSGPAGPLNTPLRIVAVLTGHGLKDPTTAIQQSPQVIRVPNDPGAVLEHLSV
jgi:threonine synthase